MRGAIAFLTTVAVLLGLGAVADAAVTRRAEQQVSEQVSAEIGAPATVDLQGWPVSLRLLTGVVPRVDLVAADVPLEDTDAELSELRATLTDVRLRLADLSSADVPIEAGPTSFEADLDAGDVERLLGPVAAIGEIELLDGLARLTVAGFPIEGTVGVEGGAIVVRPTAPILNLGEVTVPLPALPGGVSVQQAVVLPGVLRLSGATPTFHLDPADPTG
ncbi:MAG: DUF2993 domain-containing protein [Euzebyaceae bacterium]|nr:DUF2993 domain-containing protein [Euzebyaceae bacterium]